MFKLIFFDYYIINTTVCFLCSGTPQERRYNAAHIRTRNIVERVFGIWKRRFPCLRRGLLVKLETTMAIICATAVLHNIAVNRHENMDEEEIVQIAVPNIAHDNQIGLLFRRQFINRHF